MRSLFAAVLIFAAAPPVVAAQTVPEGIHREAKGPSEMCGLVGQDALDLAAKAKASTTLKPSKLESDRFEVFQTEPPWQQLAVTKPSEPAHPAVTCRYTFQEGGAFKMSRSMRCDAGRAECDALFVEFQKLDAAMIQDLQEKK